MRRFVPAVLSVIASLTALAGFASAEDFRIDSKIYSGKVIEPISQSVTLFRAGIVYDYLLEPKRVAVFDRPRQRFILLDPERKLRTEIKTEEVARFMSELEQYANTHGNAFVKGMIDPKFQADMNAKSGELLLVSDALTYRLGTIKPESPEVVQQYREFSDWYARLNAMTTPGVIPPFARLVVNEELAGRGLIPERVQLTIPPRVSTVGREIMLRSEHHVTWRLIPKDFDDIAVTAQQLVTFSEVSFAEYRAK
jgi:hypothetical protein